MARDLMDDTYYISKGGGNIPIKWTAPEVIQKSTIILIEALFFWLLA